MVHLATPPFPWYAIYLVILLAALFKQVATNESDTCYPEQCDINEFCCDGLCCSYFERNWYTWMLLVILISIIVLTCLCLPRSSSRDDSSEPVQFYLLPTGTSELPHTKPYQQQPQIPLYHSYESRGPPQHHPYRYERLVQQSSEGLITYPKPSAPPESP